MSKDRPRLMFSSSHSFCHSFPHPLKYIYLITFDLCFDEREQECVCEHEGTATVFPLGICEALLQLELVFSLKSL